MPVSLRNVESRTAEAVKHYWVTLDRQAKKQVSRVADHGRRSDVTGGKQMDGFADMVRSFLIENGIQDIRIYVKAGMELPGYFRATKRWDMLVVQDGRLLAAIEFKSQRGPSFGNNLNNRAEEALGTAHDLWTAYREGAFGEVAPPPWLGWVMLLEDCEASAKPVKPEEPHFKVFPEFRDASYARRWEILLRKLVLEKTYNSTAFLLTTEAGGLNGEYSEPAEDLGMKRMLASLIGHAAGFVAGEA